MIPIRDNIPSQRLPLVNYALIGLNAFIFVYEFSLSPQGLDALIMNWGFIPNRYETPLAIATSPLPVFSSMFLHGGLAHVGGNLLYLIIFGDNVEDRLGHLRYLFFYLLCGIAAALGQYMVDTTSAVPMVGASGAISGVLGAYLILYPKARVVTIWWFFIFIRFIELPAIIYLGGWFAYQVFSGVAAGPVGDGGGVAFWAHIGGFVAGVSLLMFFLPRRRKARRR